MAERHHLSSLSLSLPPSLKRDGKTFSLMRYGEEREREREREREERGERERERGERERDDEKSCFHLLLLRVLPLEKSFVDLQNPSFSPTFSFLDFWKKDY